MSWTNKTNYYCCFICFPINNPLRERHPKYPATYNFTTVGSSPVRLTEIIFVRDFTATWWEKKNSLNCSTMKLEIRHVRNKLITERNMIVFFLSKWVEVGGWKFLADKRGQMITKRNVLLEMYLWSPCLFNECYEKLAYLERFHYGWSESSLEILGKQGWWGSHHYSSS